jgi:thymidylate kinase
MRTATLVGIDGTGKTTTARRIAERHGVAVLHAIRPHEDPASPYAELSVNLALASAEADRIGRAQLKVAVLYLQLCLYGPAERRITAPLVLADRHPLIDPLVYLPLYARIGLDEDPGPDESRWWSALPPPVAGPVRDWLRTCAGAADVWALGNELLRLARKTPPDLLAELIRRFDVRLPDAVLLLDLPVAQALERARARSGSGPELHETAVVLSAIRSRYESVFQWLGTEHPEVAVHRLDCYGRTLEEVTGEVVRTMRDGPGVRH